MRPKADQGSADKCCLIHWVCDKFDLVQRCLKEIPVAVR
jgi:hypothetical protein